MNFGRRAGGRAGGWGGRGGRAGDGREGGRAGRRAGGERTGGLECWRVGRRWHWTFGSVVRERVVVGLDDDLGELHQRLLRDGHHSARQALSHGTRRPPPRGRSCCDAPTTCEKPLDVWGAWLRGGAGWSACRRPPQCPRSSRSILSAAASIVVGMEVLVHLAQ